jgi:non-homologous end joining protein Ku
MAAIEEKVAGKEVTVGGAEVQRAHVIDLMDALKESLARRPPAAKKPPAKVDRAASSPAAAKAERAERKAQGGRR